MLNKRLSLPDNKIIFNWDIHYSCNYRCSYCFFYGQWMHLDKDNKYPGIKHLINAWSKVYDKYGRCHIHFSGGEPFFYPDFFDLIASLSKKHSLEFSTNLSFDTDRFLDIMSPDMAKIDASFHPEFIDVDSFLKKVVYLKKKGFDICVSFVAYPLHLSRLQDFQKNFEDNSIYFVIQTFRGKFNGKVYPDNYSEVEKAYLKITSSASPINKAIFDHHVENSQKKRSDVRSCYMGVLYAKIHPDGNVYRCCSVGAQKICNIIDDKEIELLKDPEPCNIEECKCYKAMIVGSEEKWAPNWNIRLL